MLCIQRASLCLPHFLHQGAISVQLYSTATNASAPKASSSSSSSSFATAETKHHNSGHSVGHSHSKHNHSKSSHKDSDNGNHHTIPKPNIRWFYASDVPISKPDWFHYKQTKEPESFIPFSQYDSRNLERGFIRSITKPIEVNEDNLFEVDVNKFQLKPVYWEGPVYEVRRGIWFNTDGIPLVNDIAREIEEGYKKVKPYLFNKVEDEKEKKKKKAKVSKEKISKFNEIQKELEKSKKKSSEVLVEKGKANVKKEEVDEKVAKEEVKQGLLQKKMDIESQRDLHRLSNGQIVLYFNKDQAVLFPADYDSDFQIDVIRYFGPNPVSLLGVDHIQRGYSEELKQTIFDKIPDNPLPGIADTFQKEFGSLLGSSLDDKADTGQQEQEMTADENDIDDKHMQHYLEADYDQETSQTTSDREVDHLILCVHGIGQILGSTYESVNFTHSINVLRKSMKKVFEENKDYQKLAYEKGQEDKLNNRIQVLPISWRHQIDFSPRRTVEENKDNRLPTLSQINVDGIKALRNVVGDVILDVLLYYQPQYLHQIFSAVTSELNRVYKLYKEKNPNFNGKVHIFGHSLGSCIAFDILAEQSATASGDTTNILKHLDFEVDNLILAGSPLGLFKLLEGKNVAARSMMDSSYDPSKSKEVAAPKCRNLYNLFHPCDPVAYRLEPMVSPKFGDFKAVPVNFAVKGLDSQIKELASIGDEISEKILSAARWLNLTKKDGNTAKEISKAQSIEEKAQRENALGDLITSIALSDSEEVENSTTDSSSKSSSDRKLTKDELIQLTSLNNSGRIDYSLPMGVLDFSLVSAVSAHISYFEDENTAGFILKQLLSENQPAKKTVSLK